MQNPEVFEGTTLQDLLKEIHSLAEQRRIQITTVMDVLAKLITNTNDAAVIAPLVKDYMDVNVRSDEALVKIATIKQRLMAAEKLAGGGGGDILTDEEKDSLLTNLREAEKQAEEEAEETLSVVLENRGDIDQDIAALTSNITKVVNKMSEYMLAHLEEFRERGTLTDIPPFFEY